MLRMTPAQIAAIEAHAEREYPGECCGALLGIARGEEKVVEEARALDNVHEDGSARRFRIDGSQMLRLERDARARGVSVLGFYHSHPDHPAVPSEYDRAHAWPVYSYVIVSVRGGKAEEMKNWVLTEDRSGYDSEPIERV